MQTLRYRLALSILGVAALASLLGASPRPVTLQKISGLTTSFYSDASGHRFARLVAGPSLPARTRVGPFRLTSPGLVPRSLRLELYPVACSPADWDSLLAKLALLPPDLACPLTLRAPDGRTHRLLRLPRVENTTLVSTTFIPPDPTPVPLRISLGPDHRPILQLSPVLSLSSPPATP